MMLSGQEIGTLWTITAVFGAIFLVSFLIEPRQMKNSFLFFFFFVAFAGSASLTVGGVYGIALLAVLVFLAPFAAFVFLLVNTVIVTRREGVHLSTLLPALLDVLALAALFGWPYAMSLSAPTIVTSLFFLLSVQSFWFFFSLITMICYSVFYCALPHHHRYDYIIIHGAGLMGTRLTPLLRGRADKAIQVWRRQGCQGRIVCSGGQGPDEIISEAEALRRYLVSQGVPEGSIPLEDRSATTYQNVQFSKRILDGIQQGHPYRCALVTSDYHVLRAAEYSRELGLKADGIGSHTKGYYWPTAIIREFLALTREHKGPYVFFAVCWALFVLVMLILSPSSLL